MNKKRSCRKETTRLLCGSVLAKYNWKMIFSGPHRSIFNHRDVIGLQSVFEPHLWGLEVTYTVHLRLIGKLVVDFRFTAFSLPFRAN